MLFTAIAFIDASLPDLETLLANIRQHAEIHLLDSDTSGLAQIAEHLCDRKDIKALHLIGHGAPGQLFLGNSTVDRGILKKSRAEIEAIANAMIEDGEILIYGCEVAAGREGRQFIGALTEMTGLKVAAATHLVGAAELGGSWNLDIVPQALVAHPIEVAAWQGILPNTVPPVIGGITTDDNSSLNPGDYVYLDSAEDYAFISDNDSIYLNGGYLSITYTGTADGTFRFDPSMFNSDGTEAGGNFAVWTSTTATNPTPKIDGSLAADDYVVVAYNGTFSVIGQVDATNTGQSGKPLKINFTTTDATTGDATSGFTGYLLQLLQFTAQSPGAHEFSITASDGINVSDPATVTLTVLDNVPPTVTHTSAAYHEATKTLTLTGTNFSTLLESGENATTNIKARLDWSKLTWDINGDDSTTPDVTFALGDIDSAKVTNGTTLTIILSSAKGSSLEGAIGYGTSGNADTLDIAAGFAKDTAGNPATTDAVANAAITITSTGPTTSSNSILAINEDTATVLTANDFGTLTGALHTVKITTPPTAGSLQYKNGGDWTSVSTNQTFTKAEIDAGELRFTPAEHKNGNTYATIGFQVSGDGSAFSTAYDLTVNVTPVQDAPAINPLALHAIFQATTSLGTEPYITDGTSAGTVLLKDLPGGSNGGLFDASYYKPPYFASLGTKVVFGGNDPAFSYQRGLYVTDGTASGTTVLTAATGERIEHPTEMTRLGDKIIFQASSTLGGRELWVTDGTNAGTLRLKDINPSGNAFEISGSNPANPFAVIGNKAYFTADNGTNGAELWVTDGTETGTQMVKDVYAGATGSSILFTKAVGNKVYFAAKSATSGAAWEPWVSDGTASGTIQLKAGVSGAFEVSNNGGYAPQFVAVGNKVLFMAYQSGSGYELWETDGTAANTVLLKDLLPGQNPYNTALPLSSVPEIYSLGSKALIFINAISSGRELWVTDGSAANTTLLIAKSTVQPWTPGTGSNNAAIVVNGKLYFQGDSSATGRELWVTDGTLEGTKLIKDNMPGAEGSFPSVFTAFGDGIIFAASGAGYTGDQEPWFSDGTEAGTYRIADVRPGPGSPSHLLADSYPRFFTTFYKAVAEARGNKFTEIAEDVVHGSNAGNTVTSLVQDYLIIDPDLTTAPKAIAVSAVDNTHGTWQYKVGGGDWMAFDLTGDNRGKAVLLDSTDGLRFVPNANYNGTVSNGITFHAWDKTAGNAGEYLTVSGNTGGDKTLSTLTAKSGITVTPTNDAATGVPTVTGSQVVSKTLTASTANVADIDGLGTLGYQWQAYNTANSTWEDISGAISNTYTIGSSYGGKDLRVKVSFTDQGGTVETRYSDASTIGTPPNFTAFAAAVDSGNEDEQIELTYDELLAQGDESGTTTKFVVKAVNSGTLKIGTDAASASLWDATNNATIDSTYKAFWTPDANANGNSVSAFTVVAADADGGQSATPAAVTVNLAAVNDAPVINSTAVTSATQGSAYSYTLSASDVDGDPLIWEVKQGETLPSWLKVEKVAQTTPTMISITNMSYGEYAEVAENSSHIFVVDSGGHRILKIAKADNSMSYISTGASTFPLGLACDNDGNLYYSQAMGTSRGIYKISVNGGVSTLIKAGSEVHNLAYNNGHLYYQGKDSGSIVKLKADGTGTPEVIQTVPTPVSATWQQQTEVCSSGQYLYFGVSSDGTARNNIMRYDTTNGDRTMLLNTGATDFVRDIAVDQGGNVYFTIGSSLPSAVNKVNSDGTYTATSVIAMGGFQFDTSGTLWTVPYGFRVNKYQGVDQLTGTPGVSDVGSHEINIQVSDSHGGVATQTFTINVAAGAPATPALTASSDTGSSTTDNITNNATPTVTGTAVAGATVTLYATNGTTVLGTTTADHSGNWSITTSTLADGAHTLTVKQSVGGVVSAASSGLAITIDTTGPTKTISSLAFTVDTGSSTSDFNTSTAAQTINGTLSSTLAAGEEVWGSLDNGVNWINITNKISGTALTWDGVTLTGSSTLKVEVRDAAGNAGTTASQAYTFDQTAPTATVGSAGYRLSSNTLTLTGTNFETLLSGAETAATDIKSRLDWTKLSWDINGDDGTTQDVSFALSDINSAKVTNGTTLTIMLTDAKATALEATSGFGSAGAADTLDVSAGFARDAAGNFATSDTAANVALGISTNSVTLNATHTLTPIDADGITPVTINAPDGVNIFSASNTAVTGLPKNVKMPFGQFGFTLEGVESGGTVQMSMDVSKDFKQFSYFKQSLVTNKWVNIMEGVTINGDMASVKFSLKDNGEFDSDPTLGRIVDPGGVGQNTLLPMILENTTEVGMVSLQNETAATGTLSYAITGGMDATKFNINSSTGLLSFRSAPNYEAPTDAGDTALNNTYAIQVTISGSTSGNEVQNLIVTVINVAEGGDNPNTAPVIVGMRAEAQEATVGTTVALDDIRVADVDNGNTLTVTLTGANGTVGGLTDADPNTPGIQLTGTAATINTALANATFTANAAGAAGISISVVDADVVNGGSPINTTAFYTITASAAPSSGGSSGGNTGNQGNTVDGATVTTSTTTTSDGRVVDLVTIAPISDNRQEQTGDAGRADIALYYGDQQKDIPVTQASLPTGVGLTATGARTPSSNADALQNLITLVNQVAGSSENNRPNMESGGQDFLARLEQQADKGPLIINSIKLTVATGQTTAPDKPITISGTPSSSVGAPVEAIVIDTRNLPAGTVLELKNVEFAVIVGDNVTLRGGDGANIVFAGSGSQNIVLGPDDDELHGGDGDDFVGSEGGNDKLFGDAGNDTLRGGADNDQLDGGSGSDIALYAGALADYRIARLADGRWRVEDKRNSADNEGTDLLKDIEQVKFSDQTIRVGANYDLDRDAIPDFLETGSGTNPNAKDNNVFGSSKLFVMQLYRDILFREADEGGLKFWQTQLDSGARSQALVTANFLQSAEFQAGAATVTRLYFGALDRLPDNAGLDSWMGAMQSGTPLSAVASSFIASKEFTERFGAQDKAGLVDQMYLNVMRRAADAEGKAYWLQRLEAGMSKGDLVLGFTESREYQASTEAKVGVSLNYVGLLGRSPEQGGIDFWLAKQAGGMSQVEIIGSFQGTQEYHDRFLP